MKIKLPFVGELSGTWAPQQKEQEAAWELYVELITRVTVVELEPDKGTMREALSSFYSLFDTTREILRRYGPEVAPRKQKGQLSFGAIAVTVLNQAVRPLLSEWHPKLKSWESTAGSGTDPVAHERNWPEIDRLRQRVEQTRQTLVALATTLADVARVANLVDLTQLSGENSKNPDGGGA